MNEIVKLLNRLITLVDYYLAERKRHERQKAIDKIKRDPGGYWDATFGVQSDTNSD